MSSFKGGRSQASEVYGGVGGGKATVAFNHTGTSTVSPAFTGTMIVYKFNLGTTILTSSNAFTGGTVIAAGTLQVGDGGTGGTLGGSTVVNSAALVFKAGNVAVAGVHAPGNSPGIQTFTNDLTYLVGAAVDWELAEDTASNSPVVYDQVVLSGTANLMFAGSTALNLTFNGTGSLVDWSNPFWDESRAWTIYDLSAGTTTDIGNLTLTEADWLDSNGAALSSLRGGATFSVGQVGQDVVLSYVIAPVPEPSTIALAAMAVAGLALRRRHRNSR